MLEYCVNGQQFSDVSCLTVNMYACGWQMPVMGRAQSRHTSAPVVGRVVTPHQANVRQTNNTTLQHNSTGAQHGRGSYMYYASDRVHLTLSDMLNT